MFLSLWLVSSSRVLPELSRAPLLGTAVSEYSDRRCGGVLRDGGTRSMSDDGTMERSRGMCRAGTGD